jgi:DsbC/DsbD-like thiol-disulfide interchange protein
MMRPLLSLLIALLFGLPAAHAQLIGDPTSWTYESKKTGDGNYNLIFKVALQPGWHIWSMKPGGDGFQIAPTFVFEKSAPVKLIGGVKETGKDKHTGPMDGVDGDVTYYSTEVEYVQPVKAGSEGTISGTHEYQVCNDKMCLPPKKKPFVFKLES